MNMDYGTGRISEIISALKNHYKVTSIGQLPPKKKLDSLCEASQLTSKQLDELIVNNSAVLRTIKGHAFEVVFDHLLSINGYIVKEVGGDKSVDRIVNGRTLQLKTPTLSGTSGEFVQYKTHKTHGAKSERESMSYYHSKKKFSDFLVGLISYNPLKIIFLRRKELPTHIKNSSYIKSPFKVRWVSHRGVNNFQRIGIKKIDISSDYLKTKGANELLPKTSAKLNLPSNVILDTILCYANFRIWDMNMRGFAREVAVISFLKNHNIKLYNPSVSRKARSDKADLALKKSKSHRYSLIQIKGVTLNQCRFSGRNSTVAIETQLTRGRANDHPTQSRLYLCNDFDYLVFVLDPGVSSKFMREINIKGKMEWQFYAIPVKALSKHHKFSRRLKSMQIFRYLDIQEYRINKKWLKLWS